MNLLTKLLIYKGLTKKGGGGPTPTGTINITENGEYNVTSYATANVNIPEPDFKILEYIEGTGTQFIRTDFTPDNNTSISASISNIDFVAFTPILCADDTFNVNNLILSMQSTTLIRYFYRNNALDILNTDLTKYHTYKTYRGTVIIDGIIKNNNTQINSDVVYGVLSFFKPNSLEDQKYTAKYRLHEAKCYDENTHTLLHHYLPVKKKDGTVCIYDLVEKKYFTNAGTGDFVAGPEIV